MKITKCKGGQKGSAQWPIACHRCRNQRIKCVRDPEKYGINGPCVACCALPNGNSTKIEHWFPCITFGYKLHHIITYRAGNLGLTARFDHHKMANVPAVNPQEVFTIRITQRLCAKPMVLEVHYFQPADSDKLDREFVANGVRQVQKLPPVCLHDVTEASKVFVKYVTENALEAIRLAAQDDDSDDIIKEIFAMILFHLESLPVLAEYDNKQRDEKERGFLEKAIFHWFAIRLGLGSAKICGPQTLNITPVSGYMPKHGLLSVPRMIIAQFDSIRHQTVYTKLDREVLMDLERALLSGGKTQWFTVFLAMFLFLNIVSCSSRDRYRYVRENSQGQPLDTRYGKVGDPNTEYVEDLHYGAAMLLAHWDYFKRVDFASMTGKGLDPLEPYQHNFINYLSVRLQQRIDTIPRSPLDGFWESDLAWVLRIFSPKTRKDDVWLPPPIFSQVKLSAGELDEVGLDQRNDFVF
ncbi:hypothetical protein QBC44DRAFT_233776 [Cladorrhinum sp. PSN332]|nr:hypothetical protein QBC44DRAFT_233776 [Cladorrhinum sp. PSN332]